MPELTLPATKNPFLRPLYNRYFCHITIIKWSQIYKKFYQKVFFSRYFFWDPFPIKFLIMTFKTYQHRKQKGQRGKRDSFGNGMATVIKWEGEGVLVVNQMLCSIALAHTLPPAPQIYPPCSSLPGPRKVTRGIVCGTDMYV